MHRRDFLKTTGTLLGATTLAQAAAAAVANQPAPADLRVLPINRNWLYSRERVPNATRRSCDDSGFQRVVIPHANVRTPWHNFDERSYQFVSVYRRHFRLPASARGRRVFIDFEGVMTAATVWLNDVLLGQYRGGFTPFSFDLTAHVDFDGDNLLAVEVDSTERPDIPPFGNQLDYLTFGGVYREVSLRIVSPTFIENIFAKPADVLSKRPRLDVDCHVNCAEPVGTALRLTAELCQRDRIVARASEGFTASKAGDEPQVCTIRFEKLPAIQLWDLEHPNLYSVRVRLARGAESLDTDERRFGFRQATFTERGFELNGRIVKLRGLNRHQTFPFVGAAMPARVQRRDAEILRRELKCNMVRTSHYPQSRHFLDACDELGLLVLEEIPGWQHIGDESWKALAVDNVRRMIRRDWNHPAIMLWGVRINESRDDHEFYSRTNALSRHLDPTRPTGGIRNFQESEFLEDVYTMNDFDFPLHPPNHPLYLNTEFVGHTYNTSTTDNADRVLEHVVRHARTHDQLASNPQYAGGIAWCAFDYNTHSDFGSGDRICHHGVSDIFREPKRAAGFYRSQCSPTEEVVLELAIPWAPSDQAGGLNTMVVCSNCEQLKLYVGGKLLREGGPDRRQFPHLPYPPFVFDMRDALDSWGDLRIEGYIAGRQVIVRHHSGAGIDRDLVLIPDDTRLLADGADCTRVVCRVTDEFGNVRPLANEPIVLALEGPAELIGDNPFALIGGIGAVWIRAGAQAGTVRVKATHPWLGERQTVIEIVPAAQELA